MKNSVKNVELPDRLRGVNRAVFGMVCALVIGIFAWSAESGFLELAGPRAEDSYYNLLVKGFCAGQLNVKREAPPGLAQLADPYDPAANASYAWDKRNPCYEMSYYKGKLYLYFGVTPALVLFWPYAAITGHYLLHKHAVVIFFAMGFLVAAGLLRAVWRRYFPEASIWVAMVAILPLGLATGILETLSSCDVYEVAKSCGFAFTMLALAAIWCALHEPIRKGIWLFLASLAYGLAIGSRPSLLFGAIILLLPVVQAWRAATEPGSGRRLVLWLVAAAGPVALIGLGLMLYNSLRFDNPFEFGWHYQLTSVKQNTAHQFSLHYLWFNFRFYFLEPMRWGSHFPFLQTVLPPPSPSGFWGVGAPYSGILINYPLVWLALAAPLAWRGRPRVEISGLRWFVTAVFLLFLICALTLCLFFSASSRYELEFLSALMLLAVIGIFGLEQALASSPVWRRIARWSWCLLLAFTVGFNILASVETRATADCMAGNSLLHQGRLDEAVDRFQMALALDPQSASSRVGLGVACCKMGRGDEAIALFKQVLEIEPNIAEVHYDLGCGLLQMGRVDEAFVHFQKALEIEPDILETRDPAENNNLAWVLATSPEATMRNGAFAVKLAENASRRTHYQEKTIMGTLSVAYAEAGRFDEAISTVQKACALASQSGNQELLERYQYLLVLFLKHQPFHNPK
jgi:tetratricopeptide (TPR) repeat protein